MSETNIESQLNEQRVFPPSPEFSKHAHIHSLEVYESISRRALDDPEGFWAEVASSCTGLNRGKSARSSAVCEVVRRRQDHGVQLHRSASRVRSKKQSRDPFGRRAGRVRGSAIRCCITRCAACKCPDSARHTERRSRDDLHGHVRSSRLRCSRARGWASRKRCVWWIQRRSAARSNQ